MEHVGILDRFVISFRHAHDHDPFLFAEVEHGGAYQVADVFNEQHAVGMRFHALEGVHDHVCVEVASLARVDLCHFCTGCMDAVGISRRALVTFYHGKIDRRSQVCERSFQQACLSGSGGTHQVQREDVPAFEEAAVPFGQQVVLLEDILFHMQDGLVTMVVSVVMCRGVSIGGASAGCAHKYVLIYLYLR